MALFLLSSFTIYCAASPIVSRFFGKALFFGSPDRMIVGAAYPFA